LLHKKKKGFRTEFLNELTKFLYKKKIDKFGFHVDLLNQSGFYNCSRQFIFNL
jgi:hypothetical protein